MRLSLAVVMALPVLALAAPQPGGGGGGGGGGHHGGGGGGGIDWTCRKGHCNAPSPPWQHGSHPGWYKGKHPKDHPDLPCPPEPTPTPSATPTPTPSSTPTEPEDSSTPPAESSSTPPPEPTETPTEPGYTPIFLDLTGATQGDGYLTFGLVDTVEDCKEFCDSVPECVFVNTYHDVNGKDGSPLLTCSLFDRCHDASTATNTGGQTQPDGSINYITDSEGWCKA